MKNLGELISEFKGSDETRKRELEFIVMCEVRALLQELVQFRANEQKSAK